LDEVRGTPRSRGGSSIDVGIETKQVVAGEATGEARDAPRVTAL
jgi:hypothetical protein